MRATVKCVNGGWFVSFTVERAAKQRQARRPRAAVGIDLGLTRLATLSTGQAAANSKPLNQVLRTLRRLQRRLDRQRRANNPCNYLSDRRVKPGVKTWARSERMLRTERHKLVYYPHDLDELYDEQEDPWELRNLALEPEWQPLREELQARLERRMAAAGALLLDPLETLAGCEIEQIVDRVRRFGPLVTELS